MNIRECVVTEKEPEWECGSDGGVKPLNISHCYQIPKCNCHYAAMIATIPTST